MNDSMKTASVRRFSVSGTKMNAGHRRLGTNWWPAEGTDCLLTTSAYCLNFGLTLFSMQPLLRSGVLGGAQAVWLLEQSTREERLKRSRAVAADSRCNHNLWAQSLTGAHPGAIDHDKLPGPQKTLADLAGDQHRPEVNATRVVACAAEFVYNAPQDPQIPIDVLANWRSMSGISHSLPWELNIRSNGTSIEVDGLRTMTLPASWSELQGAFVPPTRSSTPAGGYWTSKQCRRHALNSKRARRVERKAAVR